MEGSIQFEIKPNTLLELPPANEQELEETLLKYEQTPEGYQQMLDDIASSDNPRTIQMILFLATRMELSHDFNLKEYPALFKDEGKTWANKIIPPDKSFLALDQYFKKHPEFFSLFCLEYFKIFGQADLNEEDGNVFGGEHAIDLDNIEESIAEAEYWDSIYDKAEDDPYDPYDNLQKYILEHIGEAQECNPEQVKLIIDQAINFILRFPEPSNIKIIDFFNKFNPEYAADRCVQLLIQAKNRAHRDNIFYILRNLEVRQMAIEKSSCTFFNSQIELVDLPHDAAAAMRLSVYGDIGVLNEEGGVVGHFSLDQMEQIEQGHFQSVVKALGLEDLFFKESQADISPEEQYKVLAIFREKYQQYTENPFWQETGCGGMKMLFLKEQAGMIHLLDTASPEELGRITRFTKLFGIAGLRAAIFSFLYTGSIDSLYNLANNSDMAEMQFIFDEFEDFVNEAELRARSLHQELLEQYPDLDLDIDDIIRGLTIGAVQVFEDARRKALKRKPTDRYLAQGIYYQDQLRHQSQETFLALSLFREFINLSQKKNINLDIYQQRQQALLKIIRHRPELKSVVFKIMEQSDQMRPIPEIFWEVDRGPADYQQRFGLDVNDLFKAIAPHGRKGTLLEFGPGSGMMRQERARLGLTEQYNDYALADRLYYSLEDTIYQLIDFSKLQLNNADKKKLASYLYKALMIERGQTGDHNFDYDQEFIAAVSQDINNLKKYLLNLGEKISLIDNVPSDVCSYDEHGVASYPPEEDWSKWPQLRELLAGDVANFIREDINNVDIHELVKAWPPGLMVGDFDDINNFKDHQIDAALGVRSTVYKTGEDYINFLATLYKKLNDGAVYIDDNVRDINGFRYRLEELKKVQDQLQDPVPIYIILGPGMPGEDYEEGKNVPLALVMGKKVNHSQEVKDRLEEGYELVTLDSLVS